MAKVILIFEDRIDGPEIEVEFDKPFDRFTAKEDLSDAQSLALKAVELLNDHLDEIGEGALIDITEMKLGRVN